jgi:hypothetical protein
MNVELLKHTDFALVPVKPDFGDIEPLFVVQEIIDEALRENPYLEARVVINCIDRRTREGKNLQSTVSDIQSVVPNLRIMKQAVRVCRPAFEAARRNGTVVVNGARTNVKADLEALFSEMLSDMVVTINRKQSTPSNLETELIKEEAHEAIVNE